MRKSTVSLTRQISVKFTVAFLLFFFCPLLAEANTDLGLYFGIGLYFIFGNILISLIESFLIARIFSLKIRRTIFIMSGANFFSALAGALLFIIVTENQLLFPVYRMTQPAIRILFSYLLTVILEWPFCYWAFSNKEKRIKRSFLASLSAQTASYTLIIFFYLLLNIGL